MKGRKVAPGVRVVVAPGELAVSTSDRNFEGRLGKGARTILASPFAGGSGGDLWNDRRLARAFGLGTNVMEPIRQLTSKTVVLPVENIDTDQIIAARFLTITTKERLGENLYADWRNDPKFVLNPWTLTKTSSKCHVSPRRPRRRFSP